MSSLHEGHANLLCIVPISTDVAEATLIVLSWHLPLSSTKAKQTGMIMTKVQALSANAADVSVCVAGS